MRKGIKNIFVGDLVSFHKIVRGRVVGLEKEVYKVIDIDTKNWGVCDLLLRNIKKSTDTVYTTRESVELVKVQYEQLTLF